jgi:hypothetical protein
VNVAWFYRLRAGSVVVLGFSFDDRGKVARVGEWQRTCSRLTMIPRIIKLTDLEADDFLKSGWTQDTIDGHVIEMIVESITGTWTAQQTWGMSDINGERRQVRKVLAKKGSKEHKISIVYDYVSK